MPYRALNSLDWSDPYPTGHEYAEAMEAARKWNANRPIPWQWSLMCDNCRTQGKIGTETSLHGVLISCLQCGREW